MSSVAGQCWACRHFRNRPEEIEAAFPGLAVLSSAYGSVRAEDGICLFHERYFPARATCGDFSAAEG
jgi:hypothetical protein